MPLSEHEERILAEIERQLADEDPRFAKGRSFRGPFSSWSRAVRLRLAVGLALVGLMSLAGLVVSTAFAVVGLAMIFTAILVGATAVKEQLQGPGGPPPPAG